MENHPIIVLIEEMKSSDVERRLNSIRNLSTIAIVLGNEKTRTDLLPYIVELIMNSTEEDILKDKIALAESLPSL